MSTCPSCHAQNRDGNRMCERCGAALVTGNWQAQQGRLLRIGRAVDNDIVLPDEITQASRYQAQIAVSPTGELVISDMGSSNGTFVNGSRLTGPTRFSLADRVSFGSYELNPGLLQPYLAAPAQAMVPQYAPPAMQPQYAPPAMQPQYAPPMQPQYAPPAMIQQPYGQQQMAPYGQQQMAPYGQQQMAPYAPQGMAPQGYAPPQTAQPARPPRPRKGSGLGVTSLVFGILGLLFTMFGAILPIFFAVAGFGLFFCFLAVLFGIIGAATGHGRGPAIAGLILGLIPGIIVVAMIATGAGMIGYALDSLL